MPAQTDCFDEFLRKVDPLIGGLYGSLEFACVAARHGTEWVLISGKAVLSTEPFNPGSEISELVRLQDLVALWGRIRANSVTNFITNLRNSWVIVTHASERILLVADGADRYSWTMPGIYSVEGNRWKMAFSVNGMGPYVSALISNDVDTELRLSTSYNGFDGLCGNLGLPARRSNLSSSFRISAELPARFETVQTNTVKLSLEIDIECIGAPDLMIEWLPQHYFERVPKGWQSGLPDANLYHTSVPLRDRATAAELRLGFGEIEPADMRVHHIFGKKEEATEGDQIGPVRGTALREPQQSRFETPFHSYTADGRVGEGGAGTVFKVRDEDGREFAIKRLDPSKMTSDKVRRFENELSFCKNEAHRNIVRVLDEGFTTVGGNKAPFYVMPFYPKTLRQLMTEGIPNEKILPYFFQVLAGVEAAHSRKVWHRDLKPENILYDPGNDTLVVADLGIAHFEEEDLHTAVETQDGVRLANFQYAAPEQRVRGRKVDQRADIYALGLILNEIFTHEILQGVGYKRIASVASQFEYLDGIVELMAQQESEKRPASIDALKGLLRARGDEYDSRQKLRALRSTVIPSSQIDDPLIDNPVRVVGADYRGGKIIFSLSQPVNQRWTQAFHNQTVLQFRSGLSPQDFAINGTTAKARADERIASEARDHLSRYLERATASYKKKLEESRRKKEENDRRALQDQIAKEEKRRRILGILTGRG